MWKIYIQFQKILLSLLIIAGKKEIRPNKIVLKVSKN